MRVAQVGEAPLGGHGREIGVQVAIRLLHGLEEVDQFLHLRGERGVVSHGELVAGRLYPLADVAVPERVRRAVTRPFPAERLEMADAAELLEHVRQHDLSDLTDAWRPEFVVDANLAQRRWSQAHSSRSGTAAAGGRMRR